MNHILFLNIESFIIAAIFISISLSRACVIFLRPCGLFFLLAFELMSPGAPIEPPLPSVRGRY